MESEIQAVREAHRVLKEANARMTRCNDAQAEAEKLYWAASKNCSEARQSLLKAITGVDEFA